ncbi:hypothetical protein V4F39_20355 [Aquincola sp. MAHUQ-54]|uniref:Uncharacterized protein n=1 Tax=Aquincola agrisoli TaxID=3119538 RepID=A0AAW9QJH2_9BURK
MNGLLRRSSCALGLVLPLAAAAHGYFPPKFGGLMSEGGEISVELVAQADRTVLHVEDHGMPIPTEGASGALGIASADRPQRVLALGPGGHNRLVGPAAELRPGDRVVARASFPDGNVMFVRFRVRGPDEPPPAPPAAAPPPFAKPFAVPFAAPPARPPSPHDPADASRPHLSSSGVSP